MEMIKGLNALIALGGAVWAIVLGVATAIGFQMTDGDWFFTIYFSALASATGWVLWNDLRVKPNYSAYEGRQQFRLYEAAALFLNRCPEGAGPAESSPVHASQLTLKDAVRRGVLKVSAADGSLVEPSPAALADPFWPNAQTWVSREQLKNYAATRSRIPRFLRD